MLDRRPRAIIPCGTDRGPYFLCRFTPKDRENGEKRKPSDDRLGVPRVQTPQLQHAEEQATYDRPPRAVQVLPLLPLPPRPPRNQIAAAIASPASNAQKVDFTTAPSKHEDAERSSLARSLGPQCAHAHKGRSDEVQRRTLGVPVLRAVAQLVELRSPKPSVAGSSPVRPASFPSQRHTVLQEHESHE